MHTKESQFQIEETLYLDFTVQLLNNAIDKYFL